MASLAKIEQARSRGIDWLLKQRKPDGSFGPCEKGIFYYRLPWTLAVTGRDRQASSLLQWIAENMFTEQGDFDGKLGRGMYKDAFYTYPNANIIYGAHIMRRFDLSYRGMPFLLKFQDQKTGGFFNNLTGNGPSGDQDIWCTSQAGLTCLVTGELAAAEKAASFLQLVYDCQPDLENKLYLAYSSEQGLITDFSSDVAGIYVIETGEPEQHFYMPGISSAFLCRLYMATGKENYLELSRKYTEFALRCRHLFSAPQVCKVGWGSALLYQVTRDYRYYELTQKVADYFIEHQFPEGYWLNKAPYRELEHTIEVTAEFVVHLDTMLCSLT